MRTSRSVALLAATAMAVAALVPPAQAGGFDPYRVERIQRLATAGVVRGSVAAGVFLHVPFQTTADRSPLAETRYGLQLALRPVAVTGIAPRTSGLIGRPLAQLSLQGRDPASLAINGMSLRQWAVLAAGEPEDPDAADESRKKHSRVWWWVGGGVLVLGLAAVSAAVAGSQAGGALADAEFCLFNPDPNCPSSGS